MTTGTALLPESTANQWHRATYAFLAEKQRRSGSDRTVQGYSGMLRHFSARSPRMTSEVVFNGAYGKWFIERNCAAN